MKMHALCKRNFKEILRDPLTPAFGLGFPILLLLLLSLIQKNIPVEMFATERLAPGLIVFGLSFLTLFSGILLARDRETAFLTRLYTTPLRPKDYIFAYILPILPLGLLSAVVTFLVALPIGLPFTSGILLSLLGFLPIALFYTAVGVLFGSLLHVKQVGSISGALFTNLSAWLSDIWFDVSLVGGVFEAIAEHLPFIHAVRLARLLYLGECIAALPEFLWVLGYAAVILVLAAFAFLRQMKRQ